MSTVENLQKQDEELVILVVKMVSLAQDLVETKMRLEILCKGGWIELAEARKATSTTSVSSLQLPTSESKGEILARKVVGRVECEGEGSTRYHHYNMLDKWEDEKEGVENEEGVRKRGVEKNEVEKIPSIKSKDPLRWFGLLPPSSLRRAQTRFTRALEVVVEVANIQSELRGVEDRVKYLRRIKDDTTKVEELGSQFNSFQVQA